MSQSTNHYPLEYVTLQGAHSPTWVAPPLDNSFSYPDVLDWHFKHCAAHPFVALAPEADGEQEVIITWGEACRAMYRLASTLREEIKDELLDGKRPVVGILAGPDSLTYATTIAAISRAGFTAFPLSVRNSLPALEHLLKATNCRYVMGSVSSPGASTSALQETTAHLLDKLPGLKLLAVPEYTSLYPRLAHYPPTAYDAATDIAPTVPPVRPQTGSAPLFIIHSSGSTSFPKPIPISDAAWLTWGRLFWYGDVDVCGTKWGVMGLPMFHSAGLAVALSFSACAGTTGVMFRPSSGAPRPPTAANVLDVVRRGRPDYIGAVPSFCVEWAHDPEAVASLAKLNGILYAGGPLPQEAGDKLIAGGVTLHIGYALTETAPVVKGLSAKPLRGTEWNFAEFSPQLNVELIDEGNNLYRLIVLETDKHTLAVSNYKAHVRAFDTNDLLEPHPTRKGYWKVIGRSDDQIMMSNGEKTNPGPLELIISGNPNVQLAVMFGRARTQVGIIIAPPEHISITNDSELASFRNLIWPDIEKANSLAPQHSRIFKEFILVIDPRKKALLRTPKGTIARNATLQLFAEEIDAIYAAAEHPVRAEWAAPPETWDEDALRQFVIRVVNGVMREGKENERVDETRDLFEQGCDSLQATYIRSAITNALREAPKRDTKSNGPATSVPQNLVFAYSTVQRLVSFMLSTVKGESDNDADALADIVDQMNSMVEKYTQDFPLHKPASRAGEGEVVLLTGSTGTLGTYILQRLLDDPRVDRVYAVNRAGAGEDLQARQRASFADRGVDAKLLSSQKLHLVEADTTKPDLGLDAHILQEIRTSLSAVIHNAWRLDFNLSVASFESHVRGTRNLIDLALSAAGPSAPQFIFTSTIGTVSNWQEPRAVPEEQIPNPVVALGNGYGESKWVTERVLVAAAEERGLKATIWRVGQLAGSTVNGAWNTTDWVPIIAASGRTMGVLPSAEKGSVSWLPTDKAAGAIVDSLHAPWDSADGEKYRYLNLVHPHPTSWNTVFSSMATQLSLPLVPFKTWVGSVEQEAEKGGPRAAERIPAIKLLEFFKQAAKGVDSRTNEDGVKGHKPGEATGQAEFETGKAVRVSETLRSLELLSERDVELWLGYWRRHGLFA